MFIAHNIELSEIIQDLRELKPAEFTNRYFYYVDRLLELNDYDTEAMSAENKKTIQ